MPDGLEYIVRPYQSPGGAGVAVVPSTPKGTQERAHLSWGGKGTMPQVRMTTVSFDTKKPQPHDEKLTEQSRQSDTVRIEQEGKPENYVDVARARELNLSKQSDQFYLDQLALQQYIASGLDPRLDEFKPSTSSDLTGTKPVQSRATWTLKN